MTIETNVTSIKATIRSIERDRSKLVNNIQAAGLSVVLHAHMHGDVTLINALVKAVGHGMKQTALVLWLQAFGPVTLQDKDKQEMLGLLRYSKDKVVADEELRNTMALATAKLWHDYKTEKAPEEFVNVGSMLAAIIRKIDNGTVRPEDVPLAMGLRELVKEQAKRVEESEA